MKFSVIWTASAIDDLDAICSDIAQNSTQQANSKYWNITEQAKALEMFPKKGRIVPELARHNIHTYREHITAPWRILYQIMGKHVYILSVVDGRRDVNDLLLQKFLP